jgi:hypothetical protein
MKHEIIYTENYALIVSELTSHGKEGQVFLSKENIIHTVVGWNYGDRLIIAHRPLKDAEILEGVPLLPEWGETEETIELNYYKELEDRREVARNFKGQVAGRHRDLFGNSEIHHMMRGFLEGYNKAKETSQKEIAVYKNAYLKLLEFVKSKFDI